MSGEILAWVSIGLTALVLAVVWLRTRPENVGEAMAQIQDVSEFAHTAVMAAEQLWRTGALPKDARLDYVLDLVQTQFGVDKETARMTAEAAVYWLKFVAPASAGNGAPLRQDFDETGVGR
jgi:hypothetical protein